MLANESDNSAEPDTVRASLIVLNFQGVDVLDACVESLLKAMSDRDELIVVDNASTDGSFEALKKYPNLVLVQNPVNRYIFGLNDGLKIAKGTFVAFLNNDIIVEPGFVDSCIARFEDGSDVFAVCPRILQSSGEEQGSRTAGVWHRGILFYKSLPHSDAPTDCFFAVGGQSFFRRDLLEQIGSIDPLFWPMYHEDIELSYRAWKSGFRIRYAPDAVVHHLGGHTSNRVFTKVELRSFVHQNELLSVWKNVTDVRMMVSHLIFLLPRLSVSLARGDTSFLKGLSTAVRRLPAARRSRRAVLPLFVNTDRVVLKKVRIT